MDAEGKVSTLLGDPKKAVLAMAIPIMISLLVAEVNSLADRAWCSGMGVSAIAAISVVRPLYNTFVGFGTGLGVGAAAVISRNIGAMDRDRASSCAIQALIIGLIFGIILTPLVFFFQSDLLNFVGSAEVHNESMSYMTCFTLCITLIIINGVIAGILNGQGAATLSTAMMVVQAVSNIILDPIFIYSLNMGIVGASVATIIATLISAILGIWFMFGRRTVLRFGRDKMAFNPSDMRMVAVAGIPQMIEFVIMYGMDAILNKIVISCGGAEGLTIYSTPDALVNIMVVPAMAVGSALVAVASAAYGQKDPERMNTSFIFSIKFGIGIVIVLALLAELFPSVFLSIFTYSDDMAQLKDRMVDALRILAIYAPMFAMTPICSGYLQSMKHPNYAVIIAIVRNIILISLFAFAATISLFAIFHGLVFGHFLGMLIILTVTILTYRSVRKKIERGETSV